MACISLNVQRIGEGGHANTFFTVLRADDDSVCARVPVHAGTLGRRHAARTRDAACR
ncbi:hypothetical protein BDI4_400053 [Burkholderia diffusa]|nr:hypothetical protein BDI4_400053 [Burkholderia diffusa]